MFASGRDNATGARRRRVAKIVATVVLLLFLVACCWVSFWPLGADEEGPVGGIERGSGSRSVEVSDVQVTLPGELDFGRKGLPVRISCIMTARAADTLFDDSVLSLLFGSVELPPVPLRGEEADRWVVHPERLEKGVATPVAVVFAAPAGSTEATLVVQFPDVAPVDAIEVPVRFGGDLR